jgi:hypothetical protein
MATPLCLTYSQNKKIILSPYSNWNYVHECAPIYLYESKMLHYDEHMFVTTACHITAETIRWNAGGDSEWMFTDNFKDVVSHELYQVFVGEDIHAPDHAFTVVKDGHGGANILQSFFNKYPARMKHVDNVDKLQEDIATKDVSSWYEGISDIPPYENVNDQSLIFFYHI